MADEAQTAAVDAAPVEGAAAAAPATDITGQQQASGEGEGDAAAAAGQGADAEGAGADAGASVDGDKPADGADGAAQGAPEQYADFTLPDGMTLEGDMLSGLTALAKAQNLNQAAAQELVNLGVAQASAIAATFTANAEENPVVLPQHHGKIWSEQTAADAELGGKNLEKTMGLAQKVFATFATKELGEFLGKTGLSHHPELIRFMNKVGKAVREDTLVTPGGGSQGKAAKSAASVLYPDMK